VSGREDGEEGGLGLDGDGEPRSNPSPCPGCHATDTFIWTNSHISDMPEQYRVIYTREDWCALFPSYCSTTFFDFATEVAVVAATGARPNLCYDVVIACVQDAPVLPDVHFLVREIVWGCTCSPAEAYPLHVIKTARPVGAATYQKTLESPLACPH